MSHVLEQDWTTKAGLRAVVLMTDVGHRCGYVAVDRDNPLHSVDYHTHCDALTVPPEDTPLGKRGIMTVLTYDGTRASPDIVFDVHGGLTYSGGSDNYPVAAPDLWWFGYDCAHCDDAPSPEYVAQQKGLYPDKPFMWRDHEGEHRTLEYCISECESLAQQIVEKTTNNIE